MLKGKHITIYVTGGIAVYKSLNIVRELIKNQAEVQVVMTKAAQKFVTPLTFATLSQRPVLTDNFSAQSSQDDFIPHIKLARWTDLAVVVPATANIIGKLANGIADDLTSTTLMATDSPKLIFPTMNTTMWENPAVQNNINKLSLMDIKIVDPDSGFLAEGESGKGRLPELNTIMVEIFKMFTKPVLAGVNVIVTAGGTKEALDPVRFIGNNSSGKMGIAMANVAADMGAHVTLISTVHDYLNSPNIDEIQVNTAVEMKESLEKVFPKNDVLIMAAAVSDFRPMHKSTQKIKKDADKDLYTIQLQKNPDILKEISKKKDKQFVVGFAAETENLIPYAKKKLYEKNVDMILANDVSKAGSGFNVDTNEITLIRRDKEPETWPLMSKNDIAAKFWEYYDEHIK
ncbi:bifunctional phosphopantothenoylcysteine decarboxylase/phosphopantothenate--cysteine ligase CoaBC [Companilactobacillus allii]|uniref:Coenzyme A biosynthesis bifunctional protein CoaBC n=1 Tax=Companilactobacillus allii TaxID=1847728 RepID=A0A1P8Q5Y3_9LACO|nr:bifunctional phosphopantothenoylcysteine decarboxylase/phosphopantothenate--cysteine ligase CoaBC [Companilactobacillus allii]APX73260.1 phosphopantothenoylcysteine decarboxylase [Companilactobacillus allii]USQ68076.1 bifunctional phosphopantothenoylcysteine decarboxylase/phosphopantothenate--cysteine ligase CoaBC [Companilactobacillus allii]